MNKYLPILLGLVGFASLAQASDSIEIDAGILYNATGTALSNGTGLLQLIASPVTALTPDGVFTPPTASSFVTGGDILVESFTMNNAFATGEADLFANFSVTGPVVAGDALLLRWFPTLTTSSSAPGVGATYGQYRSDTSESDYPNGIPWFVPAGDGLTLTEPNALAFNTGIAGGSNLETAGYASNVVVLVPEPSTFAALGCGLLGLTLVVGMRRFRQTKSA